MFALVKIYVTYAFCCSSHFAEQEIVRYFGNLIRVRANEYIKAYRPKDHLQKEILLSCFRPA